MYDKLQSCYLTKRAYDAKGRLIEEIDSHNTKTVYTYDGLDRITSILEYDASGVILSEQYLQYNTAVNENGKGYTRLFVEQGAEDERRNKVYLFDYLDRQVQETEQYGGEERSQYFEYDLAGNKISFTAKDGAATKYAYDIFGNITYALLPDGTENYFEYDYNGNCIREINGAGEEILYSYDGLNRLTKKETTNGENRSIFRTYYDFRNNVVSALDAENNKTEYSYNLRGFLTDVRQYSSGTSGQETEYSYDGEGNISSLATGAIGDSNKHIYQFELDALGRCVKETDPMGGIIQYAYETDGNLSQSIDKNGIVTSYTYDGLGRLIKEENSKGGTLCYTYNGFDEVTSVTDGKLSVKTSYNDFGEAVKIIRDKSEEGFTYDCAGRVINHTITDKDIDTITSRYSYDALGRTTAIETDGGSEYISYDTAGRISEKSYPQTGVVKKYTYYKDSTLKSLLTYVDDKLTTAENIEYDRNGNKTLWEQDGKITSYTYDGMNRLQGVKESNGVLTEYEFDSFGNISREYTLTPSGIKTKQYEYDANNRLLLSFDDNSSTRYTYDNNGNLINKTYELSGRETESYYSYDGYNRLSEYISGNTTAEYSYNPEGLRESKTVNGKYTRFIYDGENIVGELTDDNYYIYYRGTELIGAQSYDNNNYYYKLDSHGNVTDLLAHTGDAIKSYTYNPYGKENPFSINPAGNETILYHWKNETENTHNPFRYCGEYYDEESGLIYLRNRYYDPSIGRFISEDPARDGNNWYVYCGGNPINYVDPSGESATAFIVGCTVVSALVSGGAQMVINCATGQPLFDNVGKAVVSGATSGLVYGVTLNFGTAQTAGKYATIAGTLVTTGINVVDGIERNESAGSIVKGAIGDVAGGIVGYKIAGVVVKTNINSRWFKPQTLTSFFTKSYGKKIIKQTIAEGVITAATVSMYENGKRNIQGIQQLVGVDDDGIYGPKTEAAVKKFQQTLVSGGYLPSGEDDGIWGEKTDVAFRKYIKDNVMFVSEY